MGHGCQGGLGGENVFALAGEAGDFPDDVVLLGLVLCLALGGALGDFGGIERGGDADDDVGGEELAAVVGLDGDAVLDFGLADLVDDGVHLERQVDVLRGTVPHQLEFAVRRHERDDAVRVEPAQFDALVELAVLQRDAARRGFGRFGPGRVPRRRGNAVAVQEQAVVEAEFAFRHPGQICPHDDLPVDIGA